jgi:hypothetical protein
MRQGNMMRPPISTPYDPDDCIDSYGWLWTHFHKGEPSEWHLVSTHLPDGIDADPQIVFHNKSGDEPLDVDAADGPTTSRPDCLTTPKKPRTFSGRGASLQGLHCQTRGDVCHSA